MTEYIEDPRYTFDVQYGGRSGTPQVRIDANPGDRIRVTCSFMARADAQLGGFYYTIESTDADASKLTTRGPSVTQGNTWHAETRTDFFVAESDGKASFQVTFDQADLANPGKAGAFILVADNVGP